MIKNKTVKIIVAASDDDIIGNDNKIPWKLPTDMKFFKKMTSNHSVIMGRKTYESIGKPLPNRENIILTKDVNYNADGCVIKHSLKEAIETSNNDVVFIIGGSNVYEQANEHASELYLTRVYGDIKGDIKLPDNFLFGWICDGVIHQGEENEYKFTIFKYLKISD